MASFEVYEENTANYPGLCHFSCINASKSYLSCKDGSSFTPSSVTPAALYAPAGIINSILNGNLYNRDEA
jgi:hypothetical protein